MRTQVNIFKNLKGKYLFFIKFGSTDNYFVEFIQMMTDTNYD